MFIRSSSDCWRSLKPLGNCKFNLTERFSFRHSAFGAGVTVTMVDTSNVGVKAEMVGKGAIDAVGVEEGMNVCVVFGVGGGVAVVF